MVEGRAAAGETRAASGANRGEKEERRLKLSYKIHRRQLTYFVFSKGPCIVPTYMNRPKPCSIYNIIFFIIFNIIMSNLGVEPKTFRFSGERSTK